MIRPISAVACARENRNVQTIEERLDLEPLRALTFDDPKLMRKIVGALIEDASREAVAVDDAIRRGDGARVIRAVRRSARSFADVGASGAASTLHALETAAEKADWPQCQIALNSLRGALARLRAEAAQM